MFIGDIVNSGPIPVLEAGMRFAAQRQRLIAHNIANLDTPDFRPVDLSVASFQKALSNAVDNRRASTGGEHGPLQFQKTDELELLPDGSLRTTPATPSSNVLFHDRNNRDLERLMADQSETIAAYRAASELLRGRFEILKAAIAQRP